MTGQDDSKYTDPELREQIKEDIQESDKGGQPGQWSARKAQMVASEYKKQGGDYTTEKDDKQQNLTNWGNEEWQTKEGSGSAKQDDGTEQRYLPKKAWEKMTEQEKAETEQAKHEGQVSGQQYVGNTDAAKEARKEATSEQSEKQENGSACTEKVEDNGDQKQVEEEPNAIVDDEEAEEEEEEPEEEQSDYEDGSEVDGPPRKSRKQNNDNSEGAKATRKAPARSSPAKKPAETESQANNHGQAGSTDRLPEPGQKVHWKAGASMTEGEVIEILKEESMLGKRKYKASEKDPRIKVKSSVTGKEAVHKPDACYW